jgi:signal transduction histidine kinase
VPETLLEELKRYIEWGPEDEAALRAFHPRAAPELPRIANVFYERILAHPGARQALDGTPAQLDRLKGTLIAWMDSLLSGPWDEAYYARRARIGRAHVRIALPQHYMVAAMNVVRRELALVVEQKFPATAAATRRALWKALDLDLAIMLDTYREDLLARQARAERLSTFGQLAGSIAHELRNPLAVMETSLFILKTQIEGNEHALKHADRVSSQVRVANDIITQLLDMIRERPLEREPVRLRDVLAESSSAVATPPGVRLVCEGMEELPAIGADPRQLRQVFVNLLDNAASAVGDEGEIRVSGAARGGLVEISVQDTGPGVNPEILERLFDPLVTTKAKGIGLGLALARRIVERHGGSIIHEKPEGGGARFVVRLQVA